LAETYATTASIQLKVTAAGLEPVPSSPSHDQVMFEHKGDAHNCCGIGPTSACRPTVSIKTILDLFSTIKQQQGLLFARPAIVYRNSYCGR